jgi:hypothetical protein
MIFELGVPNPYIIAEGADVRLGYSAQWCVDKTAAETKAALHADGYDIRKAESKLKELATKRLTKSTAKTNKEKEIKYKLQEGLRRQEAGLRMADDDDGFDQDGDHPMQNDY